MFSDAEMEETSNARCAKVGIRDHGAVPGLRQGDGKVRGRRGLAFAWQGTRNQDHLWWMISPREQDGRSQGAKGFRHLRFRKMLSGQLDSHFVAICGRALQQPALLSMPV